VKTLKKIINKNLIKKVIFWIMYILILIIFCIVITQKISNNNKSVLGFRIFRVATGSMYPEYKVNDVLLIKETKISEIKIGDNIAYRGTINGNPNSVITHKIVDIETNNEGEVDIHTKGIANEIEDPIVKEEQIYGVVVKKIYTLSIINKIITSIYGFILLIVIPSIYVLAFARASVNLASSASSAVEAVVSSAANAFTLSATAPIGTAVITIIKHRRSASTLFAFFIIFSS